MAARKKGGGRAAPGVIPRRGAAPELPGASLRRGSGKPRLRAEQVAELRRLSHGYATIYMFAFLGASVWRFEDVEREDYELVKAMVARTRRKSDRRGWS